MQIFELSNKSKNGRRPFKAILFEVYPEDCVVDNTGTKFNDNGITWLEKYCLPHLDTIKGMSITAEFLDDDRIEILGHGDTGVEDGIPVFENATMVGCFERGYFTDYEVNGETKRVCIGEGTLDEMRYKKFVDSLETKLSLGQKLYGSIEIFKNPNKSSIEYLDGYKDNGRIPVDFIFSGFALLGIRPADMSAGLIELNNKHKEENLMDEKILNAFVSDVKNVILETNSKNSEYEAKISEMNEEVAKKDQIISEMNATVEQLRQEVDKIEKERDESWEQTRLLREEIAKIQVAQKIAELDRALEDYSEEEQAYAKDDIEAFKKDPTKVEIDSIVTKIKASVYDAIKQSKSFEKNSFNEDIYGEVIGSLSEKDGGSIFD